jgi:signal peptidase II
MKRAAAWLWGGHTAFGLVVAIVTCLADQASKLWLLYGFELGARGVVKVMPTIDFVLTWNTGISYGLFQSEGAFGQAVLLAIKVGAVALLWAWLSQVQTRLSALALGLIIGGAVGNAIDRLAHGAVVDFVLFHITTGTFTFNWYVFNLADAAIVAGVIGLLYESLRPGHAAKAP